MFDSFFTKVNFWVFYHKPESTGQKPNGQQQNQYKPSPMCVLFFVNAIEKTPPKN